MQAQEIVVKSFRLLENDLDAITAGTTEKDGYGETAAIIKVVTTQKGFVFDAGQMDIVKTVPKPAEIWVYVPHGLKKISISHPQLGSLKDYYLPLTIEAARVYEMVLLTGSIETVVNSSKTASAEIKSLPAMADIYIDGKKVGQTPECIKDLSIGKHQLRISKEGFVDYTQMLEIKGNETAEVTATLEKLTDGKVSSADGPRRDVTIGDVTFTMIRVEGGTFTMGATSEQGNDAYDFEKPAHEVTLSTFYIGETEVTQELWEAVMGNNPTRSWYQGAERPIADISWDECQTFVFRLKQKTGLSFRLPTEAEWEYAARGGNKSRGFKYSGSNDPDEVGWFAENSGKKRLKANATSKDVDKNDGKPHNVKTKRPNELGIYDMSGNVREWVEDRFAAYSSSPQTNPVCHNYNSDLVHRGGGFDEKRRSCRVSDRDSRQQKIANKSENLGLRLALNGN
jgi:formylglycine-generating enzyme required for sulfatase activity